MTDYNVPMRRPLTAALKELLETATSRPCGVVDAPLDASGQMVDCPYTVIHPDKIGRYFGPQSFPEADASYGYTIYSYGLRADQAEFMSDRVMAGMVGRTSDTSRFVFPLNPEGLVVMDRRIAESPGPARNEGKIFYVVDTFLVSVTTSS